MLIKIKTLDLLEKEEINSVICNSRTYGLMKYVMKNLKNNMIKSPDKLKLFYKTNSIEIISWFLLDEAKELANLEPPEVSIMLYTVYKHRNKGHMNDLIEVALPDLKNKILKIYADPWEIDYIYTLRLGKKYDLILQPHVTSYDLKSKVYEKCPLEEELKY